MSWIINYSRQDNRTAFTCRYLILSLQLMEKQNKWSVDQSSPAGVHGLTQLLVRGSAFIAERCNCIAIVPLLLKHAVCRLSVTRVYCVMITRLKLGSCSFHYNVARCLNFLPAKFNDKIRRGFLNRELKLGWGGFDFAMLYLGNGARYSLGDN